MKRILIVGPFASEYSLAKVNRNLAYYLNKYKPEGYSVHLYLNEYFTDILPNSNTYSKYGFLKDLVTKENYDDDIILYYNFPKSIYANYDLDKIKGSIKIGYLGWEESIFPKKLVSESNKHFNAIATISNHVKEVFRRSGISIPIKTIPHGLDIPFVEEKEYKLKTKKTFKIFHNSSGQYRKGIDLLVRAYYETFTKDDDVVLILKLYPNNSIDKDTLKLINTSDHNKPEIELINSMDLTDGELKYLANISQLHVYPSRAEGFGLPIAEALALKKNVIATNYSGQRDFINNNNAHLLNYTLVNSLSHLNIPGSKVAEPDFNELKHYLKDIYLRYNDEDVKNKREEGYKLIDSFKWDDKAKLMLDYINEVNKYSSLKDKSIAIISKYNSQCGIAEYSKDLYSKIKGSFKNLTMYANSDINLLTNSDDKSIKRLWQSGYVNWDKLKKDIEINKPDYLHIQYNYSYYSLTALEDIINYSNINSIKVILTLHSISDSLVNISNTLNKVNLIYVHSIKDRELLNKLGIFNNVKVINHGINIISNYNLLNIKKRLGFNNRIVIGTHGMIHDKKGFLELVKAIEILKNDYSNILLLLITSINKDNSTSYSYYKQIKKYINDNNLNDNVLIFSDYLKTEIIIKLLQSLDIIVLPYDNLKEGASGAIRTCLSVVKPLIITNSYIFSDINFLDKLKDNNPITISNKIKELLNNKEELINIEKTIRDNIKDKDWEIVSSEYLIDLAEI